MRAQKPPSLTRVSPFAGSRNNGIQGKVRSPVNVERPSNSPPGAAAGPALGTGAGSGAGAAAAPAGVALGTHAGSAPASRQPAAARVSTPAEAKAVRSGRKTRFDEGDGFFIVKAAVFSRPENSERPYMATFCSADHAFREGRANFRARSAGRKLGPASRLQAWDEHHAPPYGLGRIGPNPAPLSGCARAKRAGRGPTSAEDRAPGCARHDHGAG